LLCRVISEEGELYASNKNLSTTSAFYFSIFLQLAVFFLKFYLFPFLCRCAFVLYIFSADYF
ncbi:hypothetical protein, partial [Snodgrassella communis]|uniref:hypothetical protein n=1 Tax=Snodgrassella communis TaxID=2946699 RepID=UPI001EF5DABE